MRARFTASLAMLFMLFNMVSCFGPSKAEQFANLLEQEAIQDVLGFQLVDVRVAKTFTEQPGYVVFAYDRVHPIFGRETFYKAFDIASYQPGMSYDQWEATAHGFSYPVFAQYDVDGFFTGYYESLGGIVFETSEVKPKDLEKLAGFEEVIRVKEISKTLENDFGLSQERSVEIAKMSNALRKIKNKRALTDADADSFSQELLGVDFATARKALIEGNEASLIEKASEVNQIDPEHMGQIIESLLK